MLQYKSDNNIMIKEEILQTIRIIEFRILLKSVIFKTFLAL